MDLCQQMCVLSRLTSARPLVLLVYPPIRDNVDIKVLPFGLLSIASHLREGNCRVEIFDLNIQKEDAFLQRVREQSILYVGFSVFTGPMIKEVIRLSQIIRRDRPDIPLVWGGPHSTIMPELTARHEYVDIVCHGEGERTAVRLAHALEDRQPLDQVPGLAFKRGDEVVQTPPAEPLRNADEEMSFALDAIDLEPYIFTREGKRCACVLTSRGCPYRCSFCWNLMFHGRRYTSWSPAVVQREFQPLLKHGVQKLILLDSFVGPVARVKALGEWIKAQGLEWAIEDGCRVDVHNSEDFFRTLKNTGCTHVAFGAESGSQRVLDLIKKDITVDQIVKTAEARHSSSIGARYQWMTGVPGETPEDALATVRLIDRIDKMNPFSAHSIEVYVPYPGNELFEAACAAGWHPPKDLEGWGTFRWEGRYPYHKAGTWYFKSIHYSNFLRQRRLLAKTSCYTARLRLPFRIASYLLLPFAEIRWKLRRFGCPLEYVAAETVERLLLKLESRVRSVAKNQE